MTIGVAALDAMPAAEAAELLSACCGSPAWIQAMVERRPFGSLEVLLVAADSCWVSLRPADWQEAFAHHPRIGEQHGAVPQTALGQAWSAGEQAGVRSADEGVLGALAAVNREYEKRFGYVYIVCARGKTAEELLALARARLGNDPDTELATAVKEQQKIMRQRLEKLFAV